MSSGTSASNLLHNHPPDDHQPSAATDRYSHQQRPDQPRSAPSHLTSAPGTPNFPSHPPQLPRSNIHDLLSSEPHPTSARQSPSLHPTACMTTTGPPHKRLKASPERNVRPRLSARYSHESGSQAYALASSSEGILGRPRQSLSDESLESDSSPQRSQLGHAEDEPDYHAGNTAPTLQKQRKRVFSNRTKTGCMTCRERKKKCDEKKPDCQNCTKGGFKCKGYAQPGSTIKISANSTEHSHASSRENNVTIETSQPSPAGSAHPRRPSWLQQGQRSSQSMYRGYPAPQEEEQPQHSRRQSPTVYHSHHPPQHEHHRSHSDMESSMGRVHRQPYDMMPLPHQAHSGPPQAYALHHHQIQPHLVSPTVKLEQQQQAVYYQPRIPSQQPSPILTEKEKMFRGWPFQPNDEQLREDRYRCTVHLHRFNNFIGPPNSDEYHYLIDALFHHQSPVDTPQHPPKPYYDYPDQRRPDYNHQDPHQHRQPIHSTFPAPPHPSSAHAIDTHPQIQAPFHCDYGYNVHLGSSVDIGPGCRILDSAAVEIGARSILGANVTIVTTEPEPGLPAMGTGMREGAGGSGGGGGVGKRLMLAKAVIIGEDCYIGPGSTILAGARVERGAVVPACSVVR